MSEGFGEWRPADQQGGDLESGEDTSPLFANMMPTDLMPADMSWSKIKSSLEGQMPQRVLGMNYQERFKVSPIISESARATVLRGVRRRTHDET